MPMSHNGLTKLIEECGEVIQVAAKLQAYPSGDHPDGGPPLKERLELELGDLRAAIQFVIEAHLMNGRHTVYDQYMKKLKLFREWHSES